MAHGVQISGNGDRLHVHEDGTITVHPSGLIDVQEAGGLRIAGTDVVTDHGALTGLGDDDHPQYVLVNGTRPMDGGQVIAATVAGPLTDDIKGFSTTIIGGDNSDSWDIYGGYYLAKTQAIDYSGAYFKLLGLDVHAEHHGTGLLADMEVDIYGLKIRAQNVSTGDIKSAQGIQVSASHANGGHADAIYGINILHCGAGIDASKLYGLYIQNQDQSPGVVSGDMYNLYSQGPGSNYFGGFIEMPETSSVPTPKAAAVQLWVDNGGTDGKTRLLEQFQTGDPVEVAVEA